MDRDSSIAKDGDKHRKSHSGLLLLSDDDGYVGDTIILTGSDLSPETTYDVVWNSVEGKWGVLRANEITGPQYQPRSDHVTSVTTDEAGQFETEWEIPEDYGGDHTIELQDRDGRTVAEATYRVRPWFEIDRTEAPLGETFTVVGYGLGPDPFQQNYQITWDNGMVGFVTGVMNRGTAAAEIRAVPPVGKHPLQVWRNHLGVPYLQNNTQSPFGPVGGDRQSAWTVEVTEPEPGTEFEMSWSDPMWDEGPFESHYPDIDEETDAELEITPTSGQPGTDAFVEGRNFPPSTEVNLVWHTHDGNVMMGDSMTPRPRRDIFPTVTTDGDGSFQVEVAIPTDLGATKPITAEVDGRSVAVTGFMMQPKIEGISPTSGPVGTDIEVELSGIGWPMYETAYYFVYDNRSVGYVSGANGEDGIVRAELKAAGEPGIHFIDVYPALFETREKQPDFRLKPHLSYANNHPVRPLPAMHFTFEVTD